jgi:hypothetical protein
MPSRLLARDVRAGGAEVSTRTQRRSPPPRLLALAKQHYLVRRTRGHRYARYNDCDSARYQDDQKAGRRMTFGGFSNSEIAGTQ